MRTSRRSSNCIAFAIRHGATAFGLYLVVVGTAAALTPTEAQTGWISLLDDNSLVGWTPGANGGWQVRSATLAGQGTGATLRSNFPLADFQISCEYRLSGSAKVLLRRVIDSSHDKHAFQVELMAAPGSPTGDANLGWHTLTATLDADRLTGQVDGKSLGQNAQGGISSGLIEFQLAEGGHIEVRKLIARPLNLNPIFNGDNLDGWALMKRKADPAAKGRKLLKILPMPGGKKDEEKASWSIHSGALHLDNGPGQIHTEASYDNIVLQFQYSGKRHGSRSDAELILRADPNRLADGYQIPLNDNTKTAAGSILGLRPARSLQALQDPIFETVIMNGRRIDVWVDGRLVNDYEDPRPAGPDMGKEARIGAAPIAIASLDQAASIDVKSLQIAALKGEQPKAAKGTNPDAVMSGAPALTPVMAPLPSTQPAANAPPPDPALAQIVQQQNRQQEQQQRTGSLMQQALASSDPKNQLGLYDQILALDPANQAAFTGRKEAQAKIEAENAASFMKQQLAAQQNSESKRLLQTKESAFADAQAAFLRGDLKTAQKEIAMAQKLAPADPEIVQLAGVITDRIRQRRNVWLLLMLACIAAIAPVVFLFVRRRKQTVPLLYLIEGNTTSKEFPMKSQVTRIGAIPNDGAMQNDIVLNDPDRSISRFHCELHAVKNRVYLVDCGSANGTYLNGRRVTSQKPSLVRRGNQIRLGSAQTLQLVYKAKVS